MATITYTYVQGYLSPANGDDDAKIIYSNYIDWSDNAILNKDGENITTTSALTTYISNSISNIISSYENADVKINNTLSEIIESYTAADNDIINKLNTKPGRFYQNDNNKINDAYTGEIFNDYITNKAYSKYSHVEGNKNISYSIGGHVEGAKNIAGLEETINDLLYAYAHAEGLETNAIGQAAHSEGIGTIANGEAQHVQGKYNKMDRNQAFIIGNGTNDNNRSNALTVDWNGNMNINNLNVNDIKVGSYNSLTTELSDIKSKIDALNKLIIEDDAEDSQQNALLHELVESYNQLSKILKENDGSISDLIDQLNFNTGYLQTYITDITQDITDDLQKGISYNTEYINESVSTISYNLEIIYDTIDKIALNNKHVCKTCGFIYDETIGIPDQDVKAGTDFSQVNIDKCPVCGVDWNTDNFDIIEFINYDNNMSHIMKYFNTINKNLNDNIDIKQSELQEAISYIEPIVEIKGVGSETENGSIILNSIMLEYGNTVTPYEPYAPTTDIFSRTRLPLIRYFPHPVIDALISASDGQQTEKENER